MSSEAKWCCKTEVVKYLFKYVSKGVDCPKAILPEPEPDAHNSLGRALLHRLNINATEHLQTLGVYPQNDNDSSNKDDISHSDTGDTLLILGTLDTLDSEATGKDGATSAIEDVLPKKASVLKKGRK